MLLFVIFWPIKYLRPHRNEPRAVIRRTYARLVRAARWVNLEPRAGQTPGEFLAFLAREVEQRAQAQGQAASDIGAIGRAYQLAIYSDRDLSSAASQQTAAAWARLRTRLLRVWFARPKRRELV